MFYGIIAGLTTCALWGLTFVAPRTVAPFSAWDLTMARYGIFGLACLLLMVDRRFRPIAMAPKSECFINSGEILDQQPVNDRLRSLL